MREFNTGKIDVNMKIDVGNFVFAELQKLRSGKGFPDLDFNLDDILLGENIGIDSLDLAILVITLEDATELKPFENGFVMFETVGELISLFSR